MISEKSNELLQNCLTKAIVYGNTSVKLKEPSNGCTHSWKLYVKPYHDENMSQYVKKVQFNLDKSYNSPTRWVFQEPFEIHEMGYAEFEASIKIHFLSKVENPVSILHKIALFKTEENIEVSGMVVNERCDEIVFPKPGKIMKRYLLRSGSNRPAVHFVDFEKESRDLVERLKLAQSKVEEEIAATRKKCEKFKNKIQVLEKAVLNI